MSPQEKTSSRSRPVRSCKPCGLHEESFDDLDLYFESPAFDEDELATLEEFETMSKRLEREAHPTPRPARKTLEKLDKPAPSPQALPPRRKKTKRRRQIDPATCERDYSSDEVEFMNALNEYKRSSGRMFPTCSEILEVLKNLGYEKKV